MSPPNEFEMGRQAGVLEAHNTRLEAIEAKIDTLINHMEQTKGGFSILLKVGTASTAIGAGLATIAQYFIHPHP
jgi:hypothetical protein